MPLAARVAHARLLLVAARFPANRWSILVDLRSRIPMVVVSTAVDGWRERIDDLKVRWPTTFSAFFRQMRRRKRWKPPGFFFVGDFRPFCGGSEAGDGRRWEIGGERESRRREERDGLRLYYDVNVIMVHRCSWSLWTVGSLMERSCCCDWLDLEVDRRSWWAEVLISCDAVHRKFGTPGYVAQRDQILDYFNGWDVLGYIWYFLNCFFKKKQYPTLVKKN